MSVQQGLDQGRIKLSRCDGTACWQPLWSRGRGIATCCRDFGRQSQSAGTNSSERCPPLAGNDGKRRAGRILPLPDRGILARQSTARLGWFIPANRDRGPSLKMKSIRGRQVAPILPAVSATTRVLSPFVAYCSLALL